MEKHIYVISDLHLNDKGDRDEFSYFGNEKKLFALIDHIRKRGDRLIVLGDLFEFWQGNMGAILTARKDILDALATLDVQYVIGNHDIDLQPMVGCDHLSHPFFKRMVHPFIETIGGKKFKFMHGHEVDPFNCELVPGWGRMMSIFAGVYKDRLQCPVVDGGKMTADAYLEQWGERFLTLWNCFVGTFKRKATLGYKPVRSFLTPAQNNARIKEHIAFVHMNKVKEGYDRAVVGHTHVPGQYKEWYLNSGAWVNGITTLLVISPSGNAKVLHWENGSVPFHNNTMVLPKNIKL